VTTGTYDLTDAAGSASGGTITASDAFVLEGTSGTSEIDAVLSGTGKLVKSGGSTVTLGATNDFTGTVAVDGGTLELKGGAALADTATVSVADAAGATLLVTDSETIGSLAGGGATGGTVTIADGETLTTGDSTNTTFYGTMGGEAGNLTKTGSGIFTLGGDATLGDLVIDDGQLNIGTGTSDNTASFESAVIGAGTTLYVADGATLTIRIPKNIVNNGHLINDGTVNDDLDNNNVFDNNHNYNANVASNTSTINNNTPGVWTGKVLSNGGIINNNAGAKWNGNIEGNVGTIYNQSGAAWTGSVANGGDNPLAQIDNNGTWTGNVETNTAAIYNFGSWTGAVLDNSNNIVNNYNDPSVDPGGINAALWTGNVTNGTGKVINDHGGLWKGNVLGNKGTILNNSDATWDGDVVANDSRPDAQIQNLGAWNGAVDGSAGMIRNGSGGVWTGKVLNNAGVINNEAGAQWKGDIEANSGAIYNESGAVWTGKIVTNDSQISNNDGGLWKGDVEGNNNAIFNDAGGTWDGDVVANGGGSNNSHSQIDNYGTWTGKVETNATAIENLAGSWNGAVLDNTGRIRNNYNYPDGNIDGGNAAVWNGDVTNGIGGILNDLGGLWKGKIVGNKGTITNNTDATWQGDVVANGGSSNSRAEIDNLGAWDGAVDGNAGVIANKSGGTWTGSVLGNTGTITNAGIWNGDFTNTGTVIAKGQINGSFDNGGLLQVWGPLSGITSLTNTGTLDLRAGATQTVDADSASFGDASSFDVAVDAEGDSSQLRLTGNASLAGTVNVTAKLSDSAYAPSTRYTILTADSISNAFAGASADLSFLTPTLSYDDNDVYLTLDRNDVGFADVGTTANQKAAAASVESLDTHNAIYNAVLLLNDSQAQQAFEDLAGEGYSSTANTFVQNAGMFADLMTGHLDAAFEALGDGGTAASAYAAVPPVIAAVTPSTAKPETGVWGQAYGARGMLAANAETGDVNSSTGGFAVGLAGLAGDWRVGMMLHAGTTVTEMATDASSNHSADYGVGAYAGTQWGQTRLSLGAGYTRHNVDATREVAFPGITDSLSASYAANTAEAFGKLSQNFDLGVASLTPYASLAYVRQQTDGFTESGGPAALSSSAGFVDATLATLGVGADRKFAIGNGMLLTAKGGLGWRHAIGTAPDDTHALAGGTSFSVVGTPIAGDTAVVDAGLNLDLNTDNTLDFSYDGQIGADSQTHALKGTWAGNF
jgi:outer membrane autotransporter protein